MGVPANPGWQRLSFVVEIERGQVVPGLVAADEFDGTGFEHKLKQEPAQQPEHQARRRRFTRQSRTHLERRKKDRKKADLQQENVPLEAQELTTDRRERKINQPEQKQARRRSNADNHEQ